MNLVHIYKRRQREIAIGEWEEYYICARHDAHVLFSGESYSVEGEIDISLEIERIVRDVKKKGYVVRFDVPAKVPHYSHEGGFISGGKLDSLNEPRPGSEVYIPMNEVIRQDLTLEDREKVLEILNED